MLDWQCTVEETLLSLAEPQRLIISKSITLITIAFEMDTFTQAAQISTPARRICGLSFFSRTRVILKDDKRKALTMPVYSEVQMSRLKFM
ncbi:hypothetical protein N474_23145 [Pseudoalteromonas luteoviolacea CPMOR-2]|uniref:hypothetical protein n=1 Tax=Pseudoalteromonas luteoviolacea TaxID=43657 RepID=UPI0007B05555|nr:hypothetical protein [Pseudoalteromonas luteoviolacea]KZN52341.1 hypothetical protein N474_23145 [Pseudoalteromonas luteoviolacea CPMOR-2]